MNNILVRDADDAYPVRFWMTSFGMTNRIKIINNRDYHLSTLTMRELCPVETALLLRAEIFGDHISFVLVDGRLEASVVVGRWK